MGVGCAIMSEMKITDDRYTRMTSGYKVLSTKAPSKHKGAIALLWQPDHEGFEVEATRVVTPNLITFQLVTGDERYYDMKFDNVEQTSPKCSGVHRSVTVSRSDDRPTHSWDSHIIGFAGSATAIK